MRSRCVCPVRQTGFEQKAAKGAKKNGRAREGSPCDGGTQVTLTTLVQIISEPTKPLAFLTTLHNLLEHTEGPPNQPWYQVFEKYSGEIDAKIAKFDKELEKAMEPFAR